VESLLKAIALQTAAVLEAAAVLIVAVGAVAAVARGARAPSSRHAAFGRQKLVFLTLGAWLVLGLEFELAGDVVRSVFAPTWRDLGELGAIAVIRTFLNYFLERDLERLVAPGSMPAPAPEPGR
jgi:uncharacterized membrane protein